MDYRSPQVHSHRSMIREDLLDLNDALQHPGRKISVDITTELPDEGELDLVAPLEGFLEAVSTGNLLLITGEFKAKAVVECARCSGPVEKLVNFEIDEQFPVVGTPSSLSAKDFAQVAADEPFPLFEGNQLIVEALLRQALLLALPSQPLCEFGWDGDCPVAAEQEVALPKASNARPEFLALQNLLGPDSDEIDDDPEDA